MPVLNFRSGNSYNAPVQTCHFMIKIAAGALVDQCQAYVTDVYCMNDGCEMGGAPWWRTCADGGFIPGWQTQSLMRSSIIFMRAPCPELDSRAVVYRMRQAGLRT